MSDNTLPEIDLRKAGWLAAALRAFLDEHDSAESTAAVIAVRGAHPDSPLDELASEIALRRLAWVGLTPTEYRLSESLSKRLGADCLAKDELAALGMLVTQWSILMDISTLHENTSKLPESQLEVLTIMALGLKDYPLARKLHHAFIEAAAGNEVSVSNLSALVEAKLAPKGKLHHSQAALSIGIGLAYLEARVLASIASLFYEVAVIEEEGIARLHELSAAEKVDLVEVLVALAWADGTITGEERQLIQQQVSLAGLDKRTSKSLLARLDKQPEGWSELDLRPIDPSARRFILEQAILLSLVDDDQDPTELELLQKVAERLGGEEGELESILVEVAAFYEQNRDLILDFGPVSGSLGRLRRLVLDRATNAVRSNMRKIVQEVKETGELAKLLGSASVRSLSPDEAAKVKAQLLDICKTVPALAIFALPGGGLLLPILIKLLPFNILPTAFSGEEAGEGAGEPGEPFGDEAPVTA